MENLTGHITIAVDLRIQLGVDDEFYQKVTQQFLSYMRSTGTDGKHLATPLALQPIIGVQGGVDPAESNYRKEVKSLYLEAWWACNPYPPVQAQNNVAHKHCNMDLLPPCPLCQAIKYSWEHTRMAFAKGDYRVHFA